jgi:hypothetical protein
VVRPYAQAAEKLDDARVVINDEIGKHGNPDPGDASLEFVQRLLIDARHEIPEPGPVHFSGAHPAARPDVDVVAVRDQPLEDGARAGPQRAVVGDQRFVHVKEDVHRTTSSPACLDHE